MSPTPSREKMPKAPSNRSAFSRRQFFQQVSGSAALAALLGSVERASAIPPEPGSSYLDAEHVVILMQENRSFDHTFGALRGVRGFNDPRAVTLPNANPVWLQSNAAGETYAPFRLDIKQSNATWLGSLPHSWRDQTDARHHGNHDGWLDAKPSGHKEYARMPLTMGHYTREDLPFYYALADAFTICDQHFCSSLTGTTPNRLYLWTGTIRDEQNAASFARVRNSDTDYDAPARWATFPERLEDAGVSWKIYQNEISLVSGFAGEEDAWLANFTDNPIEWFEQYQVYFAKPFRNYAAKAVTTIPQEIAELDRKIVAARGPEAARLRREKRSKERTLKLITDALPKHTDEAWAKLPQRARNLHEKAFSTNAADPQYRELETLRYRDGDVEREMKAPKSDVLHQFREDVSQGKLPAVSWIVPPENFSDHPGAPWYGAWMVSEVLNILTHNPEVWKKTIFILTYDENDGYFDHVVPFGAPDPSRPETGKTSEGIDAAVEYWSLERDREKWPVSEARGSSIGLGFRVPLVVASPWSRGGYVCSQVFDHTSPLQLLENVVTRKLGKPVRETNISAWRRTVCGDLSSVFRPAPESSPELPYTERNAVLEGIHKAQFKPLPTGYRKLSEADIEQARRDRFGASWMPQQEPGVRRSLAVPYELYASGKLSADRRSFEISLEARNEVFGKRAAGAPFHVYTPGRFRNGIELRTRSYAVEAGKRVSDAWGLEGFDNGRYHLCACGPNGFLREFAGNADDPQVEIECQYAPSTGDVALVAANRDPKSDYRIRLANHMQNDETKSLVVRAGQQATMRLPLGKTHSWYDFTLTVEGSDAFARRFAGRVETGRDGYSDPAMGRAL